MRLAFCSVGKPAAARSSSALRRFSYSLATVFVVAPVDSWKRLPWYVNSQTYTVQSHDMLYTRSQDIVYI